MAYVLIILGLNMQPVEFQTQGLCETAATLVIKKCFKNAKYPDQIYKCAALKQQLLCVKRRET